MWYLNAMNRLENTQKRIMRQGSSKHVPLFVLQFRERERLEREARMDRFLVGRKVKANSREAVTTFEKSMWSI